MKVIDVYKQYFEAEYLPKVQEYADEIATGISAKVFWEKPLREAVYG